MGLGGWRQQRVPKDCKFESFWSFIWELQEARLFEENVAPSIEWMDSGPDLKVVLDDAALFVECTVYRKSFASEEFINELLGRLHPGLRAAHSPFLALNLPNNAVAGFLNDVFEPFLDPGFLSKRLAEASRRSPLDLSYLRGVENFYVYLEFDGSKEKNPDQPWNATGNPEAYLRDVASEVLGKKRGSNRLKEFHPNLLAVNFLLDKDAQLAAMLRGGSFQLEEQDLGDTYDGIFLTACGINELPSFTGKRYMVGVCGDHPLRKLLPPGIKVGP
jgi:hypothetical protein